MNTLYCAECHEALGPDECPACGWQTPAKRAERAMHALRSYKPKLLSRSAHPEDVRCAIGDLICDLHHLADTIETSEVRDAMDEVCDRDTYWKGILDSADLHYQAEKGEKPLTHLDLEEWQANRADARRMRGE